VDTAAIRAPFTDFDITISGVPSDDAWEELAVFVAEEWAERHGLDLVLFGSHRSNDDGETFRSVKAERDRLRAVVEAVEALAKEITPEMEALRGKPAVLWVNLRADLRAAIASVTGGAR
jgi:hypothetical protein